MVAAVVSGVLAIVGTIVGGVIAGSSASSTVERQLSGETEKSRAEFLRTQRQSLYAKIIGHEQDLLEAEDHYLTAMGTATFDIEVHNRLAPAMYRNHQLLSQDKTNIDIIASDPCREAFEAWFTEHAQILTALSHRAEYMTGKRKDRPTFDLAKGHLAAQDAKKEFLEAARADMRG